MVESILMGCIVVMGVTCTIAVTLVVIMLITICCLAIHDILKEN